MDTQKVAFGALLLVASTTALFALSPQNNTVPIVIGAVASLTMAAGALLVGVSGDGRPV
jgi:hypothetical protein